MDEIAFRLSITPDQYRLWEAGADAPTVAELRELADLNNQPLAVFYLPEPPIMRKRRPLSRVCPHFGIRCFPVIGSVRERKWQFR